MRIKFPFPTITDGDVLDGSLVMAPESCRKCLEKPCEEKSTSEAVYPCSYGFDSVRVDENTVVAGILIPESPGKGPARSKNFQRYKPNIVGREQVVRAVRSVHESKDEVRAEIEGERKQWLEAVMSEEQYKEEFVRSLRPQIEKGLSFVHDYHRINVALAQNINVLIETRYQGASIEERLKQATHAEGAIYWASKLLEEKLRVAQLLLHPDWIKDRANWKLIHLHGLVLKYLRIYQHPFADKKIKIGVTGRSNGDIYGPAQACGIIPHTLFDNAFKYSPSDAYLDVRINDEADGIHFEVSSLGPKIDEDEREKIFAAFYRGRHAAAHEEEGAGYGLYVAQMVARAFNTRIHVDQKAAARDLMRTTFKVVFPYARR